MKKAPYISGNEFPELLKVGVMVGELKEIAKITQEASWKRLLNGAANYCNKVMMERLEALDRTILDRTHRKIKTGKVTFSTYDNDRSTTKYEAEKMIINNQDLITMWMAIDNFCCTRCKQTNVGGCELRKMLHRTGCPVYKDTPADGECEFHCDVRVNDMNLDIAIEEMVKKNV